MPQKDRIERITRLLNKNFLHMTFDDKKKVLSLVITEKECDEILVKFLARQYNVDIEKEKGKFVDSLNSKREQVYRKGIRKNDELEEIPSPQPTPTPLKSYRKTPVRPEMDEDVVLKVEEGNIPSELEDGDEESDNEDLEDEDEDEEEDLEDEDDETDDEEDEDEETDGEEEETDDEDDEDDYEEASEEESYEDYEDDED